ncbi:TIGR02147 family protein [Bdellovibrio sp. KM01]|uniref:TIGR02147 family protein n=1 Tax=Bdellovibrio sp. KM01 TaxID=2748865 RepID=UPI0015EA3F99|nr:TIGR02147 family protein [Bdellovibrio sp. KM01]QLY23858.1 TIGR02147 family protein [Bdellovibrio sp. KM01]
MQTAQELLKLEFDKRRERNPNFSLRAFARYLEVSPAQLSQMMTGKRTITVKTMKKMGSRLDLSPTEKSEIAQALLKDGSKHPPEAHRVKLDQDRFHVISDWYHFAILSLTRIKDSKADPRWIARRLGISVEEAHQAVLRMERMGILQTKPKFKQVGDLLDVDSEIPSEAIRKYHKQNLDLAIEKIDTVENSLRQIQSMSLPINPKKIDAFKKLIDDFLENASDLSGKSAGTEVYSLNVQFVPVTSPLEK